VVLSAADLCRFWKQARIHGMLESLRGN
jgi:hypothetical protein